MTNTFYQITCQKIISGGQTGVDRGALDACLVKKFPCGGWCPKGRLAEDGKFDQQYPLEETQESDYKTRTRKNIENSEGTLIISQKKLEGGTLLTFQIANKFNKPVFIVSEENIKETDIFFKIMYWLKRFSVSILNIAGPRKSEWEDGYKNSYYITSILISEIEKYKTGTKPDRDITNFKK